MRGGGGGKGVGVGEGGLGWMSMATQAASSTCLQEAEKLV